MVATAVKERFWTKSYDRGMTDLDPSAWETTNVKAMRVTFDNYPDKVAMEFLGVEITYRQLDEYSNRFANMLIQNGFNVGDIVAVSLANCPQYVITWLGALKAGCVISGASPLLSKDQLHYQLKDLGAGGKKVALVTLDAIFAKNLVQIADNLPQLKLVIPGNITDMLSPIKSFLAKALKKVPKGPISPLEGKTIIMFKDVLKNYPNTLPNVHITPDDLAYIQYTGGTTGDPKGAMLTHRSSVADLLIVQKWLGWDKDRGKHVALSGFPFFHIAGLFFCVNCVFLGWTQILIPNPRDTDFICEKIDQWKPNYFVNVPALYQILLNNPRFRTFDYSNLYACISAASPFPKESQEKLESIVGKGKLLECYGMTETSPLSAMNPSNGVRKLGTVGLPYINVDIKLVNPATGEEVPLGGSGEICVKGPIVMKGYYNKPEETAKTIDKDGYMHTGDVGIFDEDGYLRIVDRLKDMLVVGGYKVFSSKVEDTLAKHPSVNMIALVGKPNPERPGSEIVVGFMTIQPGYQYESEDKVIEDLLRYASLHCAPYEVPKQIFIRQELPLTTVGKVNKRALRAELASH